MRSLLTDSAARAIAYLEGLNARPVAPMAIDRLDELDKPLADQPTPPEEVLRELDEIGSPATMAMAGPRFFGFVIGGALPVTLAANWLAGAWDQNSALYNVTPATAQLERIALEWLVSLFGLPAGTGGGFVTGATMANFTALAAARYGLLERVGWNVANDGLFGAPPITVIVGQEAHVTLLKTRAKNQFGDENRYREFQKGMPLGRPAHAREIGDLMAFLASDRSGYTSGVIFTVDGGHTSGWS